MTKAYVQAQYKSNNNNTSNIPPAHEAFVQTPVGRNRDFGHSGRFSYSLRPGSPFTWLPGAFMIALREVPWPPLSLECQILR